MGLPRTSKACQRKNQVWRGENHCQQRRTVPAETIPGGDLRSRTGHGQRLKGCERKQACRGNGHGSGSRLRPEEKQRQHSGQGDQAEDQGVQGDSAHRRGLWRTLSLRDGLGYREQPKQRACDEGSMRS